jgi:hypothetical protein
LVVANLQEQVSDVNLQGMDLRGADLHVRPARHLDHAGLRGVAADTRRGGRQASTPPHPASISKTTTTDG